MPRPVRAPRAPEACCGAAQTRGHGPGNWHSSTGALGWERVGSLQGRAQGTGAGERTSEAWLWPFTLRALGSKCLESPWRVGSGRRGARALCSPGQGAQFCPGPARLALTPSLLQPCLAPPGSCLLQPCLDRKLAVARATETEDGICCLLELNCLG